MKRKNSLNPLAAPAFLLVVVGGGNFASLPRGLRISAPSPFCSVRCGFASCAAASRLGQAAGRVRLPHAESGEIPSCRSLALFLQRRRRLRLLSQRYNGPRRWQWRRPQSSGQSEVQAFRHRAETSLQNQREISDAS